jgi:hypothetical protein
MVAYKHINRGQRVLLIYFNDMFCVGDTDIFSCYRIITDTFPFDILFIKDICSYQWYLGIMEECRLLISNIIEDNNYAYIFGLTDSSGTIPMLNIAPYLSSFREGIIINGQTTLKQEIVDTYKHSRDCAIINPRIVSHLNKKYISPLENLTTKQKSKFRYYYNNSISDYQYYLYTSKIYSKIEKIHVNLEEDNGSHDSYIRKKFLDKTFMQSVLSEWLRMVEAQ